jgi:hypothetical protein
LVDEGSGVKTERSELAGSFVNAPTSRIDIARRTIEIVAAPRWFVAFSLYTTVNNPFCMNVWIVQKEMQYTLN